MELDQFRFWAFVIQGERLLKGYKAKVFRSEVFHHSWSLQEGFWEFSRYGTWIIILLNLPLLLLHLSASPLCFLDSEWECFWFKVQVVFFSGHNQIKAGPSFWEKHPVTNTEVRHLSISAALWRLVNDSWGNAPVWQTPHHLSCFCAEMWRTTRFRATEVNQLIDMKL